ncbi:MAG: choice-of-anchor M domain-containing protein [Proteobacteria bacterium]|nr:choice-of-anchor M domain-containing protein [Pseudomonadota bacterium]
MFVEYEQATDTLSVKLRSHLAYPPPANAGPEPVHEPADVCIIVPYSSYESVQAAGGRPGSDAFAPLGVAAAESFWLLETRNLAAAQPFFGVSTQGVAATGAVSGTLRLEVQAAPPANGHLSVFRIVGITPTFAVSTSTPAQTSSGKSALELPPATHEHYNWAFSHAGRYDVSIVAEAQTPDGLALRSEPAHFRFEVEPDPDPGTILEARGRGR